MTIVIAHIKSDGRIANGQPCALCVHRTLPRLIRQNGIARLNIVYTCNQSNVEGVVFTTHASLFELNISIPSSGSKNRIRSKTRNWVKRPPSPT